MKKMVFKGAACAIVTPFFPDGSINFEVFSRLIEFQLQEGTDAIVATGTTGEASTMYDDVHLQAIEHCVKVVNGRVPVIAGCGSNHTHHAIKLSVEAEKLGADALLHVTPYYNKTSQAGLIAHFTAIASAVSIPIILYNVPSRTGMTISPETYVELAKVDNIVATKEASGNLAHMMQVSALCGEELPMYSGNDDQVTSVLALGGLGVISVISNIVPRKVKEMCAAYFAGEYERSLQIQKELLPISEAMFCEVNPIPIKEALMQMGFSVGSPLLPLVEPSVTNKQKIHTALIKEGLL